MNSIPAIGRRRFFECSLLGVGAAVAGKNVPISASANDVPSSRTMPRVPGVFRLRMRSCEEPVSKGIAYTPKFTVVDWNASETAIIVCDMWSDHPCKMAAQRVDEIAPKMNATITKARDHGAFIVHAPSNGVEKFYAETPFRARMRDAPEVQAPVPITGNWECEPDREPELPVEANRRGENLVSGCDDPEPKPHPDFDRRQHPAIKIIGWDGISESGQEVWNVFQREGIRNVVLMGVHTNMCVLGRPFGIRMMCKLGFNVALCRDLTDALYDPRDPPHVSHARGVELVIEHIEKYWCPSILGEELEIVVPGSNNPV